MLSRSLTRVPAVALATLGMLATLFALVGVVSAPSAYAEEPQYGYQKVTDQVSYLSHASLSKLTVLHVDTEHATADGFWFAYAGAFERPFAWRYQPYGMHCTSPALKVGFNPWLGTYRCRVDMGVADEVFGVPYVQRTADCQASTGYPYMAGANFPEGFGCSIALLDTHSLIPVYAPTRSMVCAPWEGRDCLAIHYPWETDPEPLWLPAPDACTQMPADTNRTYARTAAPPHEGGDGTCDGSAPAPNCEPGNTHISCTGTTAPVQVGSNPMAPGSAPAPSPSPSPAASFTRTATDTITAAGEATEERTVTRRATVTRRPVTMTATKRVRGRVIRATGKAPIRLTAPATRSARVTLPGEATVTREASCTAATEQAAVACAQAKATKAATSAAAQAAEANASMAAGAQAQTEAARAAQAAAVAAAKAARVTPAMVKAAKARAMKLARKNLAAKLAKLR